MTHEQQALLYLVRLGIGNDIEPGFDFKGVDWRNLIDLSFDQAVAAIAINGLSKVGGCTCKYRKYPWIRLTKIRYPEERFVDCHYHRFLSHVGKRAS